MQLKGKKKKKKIFVVYGECTVIKCVKSSLWSFCARDFSLDNAPWLYTPDEVNSHQIENRQHLYHTRDSDILKISK